MIFMILVVFSGADQNHQTLHKDQDRLHFGRAQHRALGRRVSPGVVHPRKHDLRADRPGKNVNKSVNKHVDQVVLCFDFQVNGVLELDKTPEGTARYTALDRWSTQLSQLQKVIINKMT